MLILIFGKTEVRRDGGASLHVLAGRTKPKCFVSRVSRQLYSLQPSDFLAMLPAGKGLGRGEGIAGLIDEVFC